MKKLFTSTQVSSSLLKTKILIFLLLISFFSFGQTKSGAVQEKVDWKQMGNNRNTNFYSVKNDFNQYWDGKKPQKGQSYKVFKRWEEFMAPRVYPSGDMSLPSTAYGNYMEWLQTSNLKSASATSATSNWTSLGPVLKPSGFDAGVGRVDFVRFDPANSNTMYVGATDGGLWKSTTGGTSWTTNTDFLPIIGVADLVIDSSNSQIMYLATGSWEEDRRSIGVLKSTDGGTSWKATGLSWKAIDEFHIKKLIMHPKNPLVMMIATNKGIYRTSNGWTSSTEVLGDNSYKIDDIEFKPGDPSTVYAIGKDSFWKSSDNGATWTLLNETSGLPTSDVSRALLGVTAANPAYVYALMGNAENGYKGLYRSTNSGASFSTMSTTPNILHSDAVPPSSPKEGWNGGQANHDLAIVVSPTDADKVTIGGINQWRSIDGGANWNLFTWWLGIDPAYPGEGKIVPYTHADIQDIQYLPGSSTTMFTTSDGGIYKTTDDGISWTDISSGLSIAQQTSIAVSQTEAGYIITGLQDIGTLQKEAGAWKVINGGDGEDCLIRRDNGNFNITSGPNGEFSYSDDKGAKKYALTGLPKNGEWFSPIQQDPVNDALIYAGGWPKLYKTDVLWTTNEEAAWTALGTPPGTGNILRFAVAPSSTSTIYAIKEDNISKSTDSGVSWASIKTGALSGVTAQFFNLTVSNTDANKVWVVFSGYNATEKVFKTTDGGATWTNISTGLPNLPMTCIVYQNNSANDAVYLGADIGIYYMNNSTPWAAYNTGLPNCHVTDLEIYYPTKKLLASTYGRGSWESDLYTAPNAPVDWTLLVYLCGSDSESKFNAGTNDIAEMMAAGTTDWVNVIVLTGGSNKEGWKTPKSWLIKNGVKTPLSFVPTTADMGTPQTLTEFINWGTENYPANSTMLTIWNHGAALRGAAFDKVSGYHLSVPDIKQGIGNSNFIKNSHKFDVIGFDAGLMANLEVQSNIKDFAWYFVASEDEEPGHGWDYKPIIEGMESGENLTGDKIGKIIVDAYKAQSIAKANGGNTQGVTLSLTDLYYISDLETGLAALFEKIKQDSKVRILQQARGKSEEYGKMIQSPKNSEDVVDIGDLMNKLKVADPSLSVEADAVLAVLKNTVLHNTNDQSRPFASGMTVYVPYNSFNDKDVLNDFFTKTYTPLGFSPVIKDFIKGTYTSGVLADYTPPTGVTGSDLKSAGLTNAQNSPISKSANINAVSSIKVTDDDDLEGIQVILVEEFEGFPNEYIALGSSYPDTAVVNDDGTVTYGYHFDDYWLGINGYPAYIADLHYYEIEDSTGYVDAYTRVYIPAILNPDDGENEEFINIVYRYDEDFNITIEGILPEAIDEDGRVPSKERITLVPGDQVQLLYESFNEVTGEEFFVVDDRAIFTIENGEEDLQLEYGMLDEGNYYMGWVLTDYSQNDTLIFDQTLFTVVPTSIDDIVNESKISVFPNPADQQLVVEYKGTSGKQYRVRLFDINGKLSFNQSYNEPKVSINTSQLQSGFYTVEVISDELRYSDEIIIVH